MEKGEALELMAACIKRNMKGLTAKVSGPLKAGPLERKVRPEGRRGRPPWKSAQPTKKRWATEVAQRCKNDSWLSSAAPSAARPQKA